MQKSKFAYIVLRDASGEALHLPIYQTIMTDFLSRILHAPWITPNPNQGLQHMRVYTVVSNAGRSNMYKKGKCNRASHIIARN